MTRSLFKYLMAALVCGSFLDPTDAAAFARVASNVDKTTKRPAIPVVIAPSLLPLSQVNLLLTDKKQDQSDRFSVSRRPSRPEMPGLAGVNLIINNPSVTEATSTTPAHRSSTNRWNLDQEMSSTAQAMTPSLVRSPADGVRMSSPAPFHNYGPSAYISYIPGLHDHQYSDKLIVKDNVLHDDPQLRQPTENLLNWLMMVQSGKDGQPVTPLDDLNRDDILNYDDYVESNDYVEEEYEEEETMIDKPILAVTENSGLLHLSTPHPLVNLPTRFGSIRQTMNKNPVQEISEPRLTTQPFALNRVGSAVDNTSARPEPVGLQRPTESKKPKPTTTTLAPAVEKRRPEPVGLQRPAAVEKKRPESIGLQGPSQVEARRPGQVDRTKTTTTKRPVQLIQRPMQVGLQKLKPQTEFQKGSIKVNLVTNPASMGETSTQAPKSDTTTEQGTNNEEQSVAALRPPPVGPPVDDVQQHVSKRIENLWANEKSKFSPIGSYRPPYMNSPDSLLFQYQQSNTGQNFVNTGFNSRPTPGPIGPSGQLPFLQQSNPLNAFIPSVFQDLTAFGENFVRPTSGPAGPPFFMSSTTPSPRPVKPIDVFLPTGIIDPIGVSGNVIKPGPFQLDLNNQGKPVNVIESQMGNINFGSNLPLRPPFLTTNPSLQQQQTNTPPTGSGVNNNFAGSVVFRPPFSNTNSGGQQTNLSPSGSGVNNNFAGNFGSFVFPFRPPFSNTNFSVQQTTSSTSGSGNVNNNLSGNFGGATFPLRPPFLTPTPAGQQQTNTPPTGSGVNIAVTNRPGGFQRPPFIINNNAQFDLFQDQQLVQTDYQMGNAFLQQPIPSQSVGSLFTSIPVPPLLGPGYYQMGGYFPFPFQTTNSTLTPTSTSTTSTTSTTTTTIAPLTATTSPPCVTTTNPVTHQQIPQFVVTGQVSSGELLPVTSATPVGDLTTVSTTTTTQATTTMALTAPAPRPSFSLGSSSSSSSSSSSDSSSSGSSGSFIGTSSSVTSTSGIGLGGFFLFFCFLGMPVVFGLLSLLDMPDIVMGILIAGVVPVSLFFILGVTGALVSKKRSNSSFGRTAGEMKKRHKWTDWRGWMSPEELRRLELEILAVLEDYPYRDETTRRDDRRR